MENIGPHALGRPAHKAVVQGCARPVDRRRVDPTASGLQNMNDSADHPAVIHPELATRICGKKRLKPSKLRLPSPPYGVCLMAEIPDIALVSVKLNSS